MRTVSEKELFMKKTIKCILCLLLSFTILLDLCSVTQLEVYGQQSSDFIIDRNGVLTGYTGIGGNIVIPDGTATIGKKAFSGCTEITSVTMPNSIKKIESGAFDSCYALTSITLSNKLTTIEDNAFWGCTSLKFLEIPNSVETIGFGAFGNCDALTGVYISKNVISIGNYAFGYLYYGDYIQTLDFIIMGEKNSAAKEYADKYAIPFATKADLKASLISAKKKSNTKILIKWKKNEKVTGYEIQYSTGNKFASSKTKTITVKNKTTVSKTVSRLHKGNTYFVRIRGYRTISGKKYYSDWGTSKKIAI